MATQTFNYTGAPVDFVVPAGVESITVECWGAQGGGAAGTTYAYGGYARSDVKVTPGEVLRLRVGGQPTTRIVGGYNGGGKGGDASSAVAGATTHDGWGGGGASDVRRSTDLLTDRLVVAGGGGGKAGYFTYYGGWGGGANGQDGQASTNEWNGKAAKNDTGGLGGGGLYPGGAGTLGKGGDAADVVEPSATDQFGPAGGGGGGGGHYGGGAGSSNATYDSTTAQGAGGGGDGLGTTLTHAARAGHGVIVLTWTAYTNRKTFTYTGAPETFTVPAGVTSLTVECWGAQGGNFYSTSMGYSETRPGLGGYAKSIISVFENEPLTVRVGGQPVMGTGTSNVGGFNGGGNGGPTWSSTDLQARTHYHTVGGGGGASDVRRASDTLVDRVCVGGGGGGNAQGIGSERSNSIYSYYGAHGNAGGASGAPAYWYNTTSTWKTLRNGRGASSSAGGAGGVHERTNTSVGAPGALGLGGAGGQPTATWAKYAGAGGGGGYYGGGGGAGQEEHLYEPINLWYDRYPAGGGGGGSSFWNSSSTANVRSGHGLVVFTWADPAAPQAPPNTTLLSPADEASLYFNVNQTFDWSVVDPNADPPTGWAFRRRIIGSLTYEYWNDTTKSWQAALFINSSSATSYTFLAGQWPQLQETTRYDWSVATQDNDGLGEFAPDWQITSVGANQQPPTTGLLSPASGVTLNLNDGETFDWSYSDPNSNPQTGWAFRRRLQGALSWEWWHPGLEVWTPGEVFAQSTDTAYAFPPTAWAGDGKTYEWTVASRDQYGAGPYATPRTVTSQYVPPPTPPTTTLASPSNSANIWDETPYFDWTVSDVNNDAPDGWAFRRRIQGTVTWEYWNVSNGSWQATEVINASADTAYTFPVGAFLQDGRVWEWSVASRDKDGRGPYADPWAVRFKARVTGRASLSGVATLTGAGRKRAFAGSSITGNATLRADATIGSAGTDTPTNLAPPDKYAIPWDVNITFDWAFQDPNPDDTQQSYQFRRRRVGVLTYEYWNATTGTWSDGVLGIPTNLSSVTEVTFTPTQWDATTLGGVGGDPNAYVWGVRTTDNAGNQSGWSATWTTYRRKTVYIVKNLHGEASLTAEAMQKIAMNPVTVQGAGSISASRPFVTTTGSGWFQGQSSLSGSGHVTPWIRPTGLSSAEAFGTLTVKPGPVSVAPLGIGTEEAFGAPQAFVEQTVTTTGIASTAAVGTPGLTVGPVTVYADDPIFTEEAIPRPAVNRGPVTLASTGIPGEEAFGTATVTIGPATASPQGLPSAEVFGTPFVSTGTVAITTTGIPSLEAFGTATIRRGPVRVTTTGIPSAQAFGATFIEVGEVPISPAGIASTSAVGTPGVVWAISPLSIASREAFGAHVLGRGPYAIRPAAIHSEERVPKPSLSVVGGFIPLPPDEGRSVTVLRAPAEPGTIRVESTTPEPYQPAGGNDTRVVAVPSTDPEPVLVQSDVYNRR